MIVQIPGCHDARRRGPLVAPRGPVLRYMSVPSLSMPLTEPSRHLPRERDMV